MLAKFPSEQNLEVVGVTQFWQLCTSGERTPHSLMRFRRTLIVVPCSLKIRPELSDIHSVHNRS